MRRILGNKSFSKKIFKASSSISIVSILAWLKKQFFTCRSFFHMQIFQLNVQTQGSFKSISYWLKTNSERTLQLLKVRALLLKSQLWSLYDLNTSTHYLPCPCRIVPNNCSLQLPKLHIIVYNAILLKVRLTDKINTNC